MNRLLGSVSYSWLRCLVCFVVLSCITVCTAVAQTTYASARKQRKEQKRFLKEAQKASTDYQETHLNPNALTLKRGKAARKQGFDKELRRSKAVKPKRKIRLFKKN